MFSGADRQETLEACGLRVATESGELFYVMEPQWADAQMKYTGSGVDQEPPIAWADHDDIKRLGIISGEDGSVLVFGSERYRVLAIEPMRSGFCTLVLGTV